MQKGEKRETGLVVHYQPTGPSPPGTAACFISLAFALISPPPPLLFNLYFFFPSRMGRIPGVGVANSLVPVNSFLAINISFSEMLMALNPFLGCSPRRTSHPLLSYAVCPCWDRLHHSRSLWERKTGISSCAGRNAKNLSISSSGLSHRSEDTQVASPSPSLSKGCKAQLC